MTYPLELEHRRQLQMTLSDNYVTVGKEKLVYLTKGEDIIGYIDVPNKMYATRKVLFVKFNGLSLSKRVMELLEAYNVENILFESEGKRFYTTLAKFYVYGQPYNDKGEEQLVLGLEYFNK